MYVYVCVWFVVDCCFHFVCFFWLCLFLFLLLFWIHYYAQARIAYAECAVNTSCLWAHFGMFHRCNSGRRHCQSPEVHVHVGNKMAEAAVESPLGRFYCHQCSTEITPNIPVGVFPFCRLRRLRFCL